MAELMDLAASWQTLMLALVVFGIAPRLALRLIMLLFRRDDPRRRELFAELHAVPRIERPLWVAEQLEVALSEGLWERIASATTATGRTILRWRLKSGVKMNWKKHINMRATCTLLRPRQQPVVVKAWWMFDPAEPFAVTLSIAATAGRRVGWLIGREFLATGLSFPIGAGTCASNLSTATSS